MHLLVQKLESRLQSYHTPEKENGDLNAEPEVEAEAYAGDDVEHTSVVSGVGNGNASASKSAIVNSNGNAVTASVSAADSKNENENKIENDNNNNESGNESENTDTDTDMQTQLLLETRRRTASEEAVRALQHRVDSLQQRLDRSWMKSEMKSEMEAQHEQALHKAQQLQEEWGAERAELESQRTKAESRLETSQANLQDAVNRLQVVQVVQAATEAAGVDDSAGAAEQEAVDARAWQQRFEQEQRSLRELEQQRESEMHMRESEMLAVGKRELEWRQQLQDREQEGQAQLQHQEERHSSEVEAGEERARVLRQQVEELREEKDRETEATARARQERQERQEQREQLEQQEQERAKAAALDAAIALESKQKQQEQVEHLQLKEREWQQLQMSLKADAAASLKTAEQYSPTRNKKQETFLRRKIFNGRRFPSRM